MGIMQYITGGLQWLLDLFVGITGSYGLAIIAVTLLIRFIMYPLTLNQTKSMAAMKELQPKLKELQEKYKSEPKVYQEKTMELYREHKVNPLGGCLPMLVQLPFLWAFFRVLQDLGGGDEAQFLGLWDLSLSAWEVIQELLASPDVSVFALAFGVIVAASLPLISSATTFWQMTMTATDPSQKTMMMVMPVMIGVFSFNFPAGLVLYWVVSNLFSIGQQFMITKDNRVLEQGGRAE